MVQYIGDEILEMMLKEKFEPETKKSVLNADKEFMEWLDKEFPSPFKKRA